MIRNLKPRARNLRVQSARRRLRRGVITVLAAAVLVVLFGFLSLSVDSGRITMTQNQMQIATDAAALAASQEISSYIANSAQNPSGGSINASSQIVASARTVAADVAAKNGVYIDPATDVEFGKRTYNAGTNSWPIAWGATPFNVIRVTARRTNTDTTAQDGQLPLAFGWAVGKNAASITTSSIAFVQSRDIVVVLDFSGSMNDDSTIASFGKLGQSNVEANLDAIWNKLVSDGPTWPNTTEKKFPSTGFGGINSALGTYNSSTDTNTIFTALNLGANNTNGTRKYPFPQAGKDASGNPKSRPSATTSDNAWKAYINYVKGLSNSTYKKRYGYRTLTDYLLTQLEHNNVAEDLWRTPHYPFHAIKEGTSLFLNFLSDLEYSDEVGIVCYAETSRVETSLNEDGYAINLASDPITNQYTDLDAIQRHRQAGHYESYTAIGYGVKEGRTLLANSSRYGARKTMILMTDGLANRYPSGWSLPSDWNWAALTDYDGDGVANYTTTDKSKCYAFWEVKQAIDAEIVIHTMSVGVDGDRDFMEAVAFAAGGIFIDVPGGSNVDTMQQQLLDAFAQIAAKVPGAKLTFE